MDVSGGAVELADGDRADATIRKEFQIGSETSDAATWDYNIVHTDRLGSPNGPQLGLVWKQPYSDSSTDWDQIKKLGREGWEMVNAFPVEASGTLQYPALIFKRRIQALAPVEAGAGKASGVAAPAKAATAG